MTNPAQPNHETLAQTVARLRELMAKAPKLPPLKPFYGQDEYYQCPLCEDGEIHASNVLESETGSRGEGMHTSIYGFQVFGVGEDHNSLERLVRQVLTDLPALLDALSAIPSAGGGESTKLVQEQVTCTRCKGTGECADAANDVEECPKCFGDGKQNKYTAEQIAQAEIAELRERNEALAKMADDLTVNAVWVKEQLAQRDAALADAREARELLHDARHCLSKELYNALYVKITAFLVKGANNTNTETDQ